jgi:hypothetical protein
MKALAVVLFLLLVAAHPVTAAAVLAAELVVCTALGWLIWRAVPLGFYRLGRTA